MDSSYRQEPLDGGRIRFTVTPASVPKASGAPSVITAIFVLVVLGTMNRAEGGFGLLIRLAIAVFGGIKLHGWINAWFANNVNKRRSPGGTFVASPSGLEPVGEPPIAREQIHRIIIRNGIPEGGGGSVVVDTGTMYSAMQAGAANDGARNRAKAVGISYMLCAEHGGRSTTLGGGMNEVTAYGLLTDVSRVLGMAVS